MDAFLIVTKPVNNSPYVGRQFLVSEHLDAPRFWWTREYTCAARFDLSRLLELLAFVRHRKGWSVWLTEGDHICALSERPVNQKKAPD